jgi:O-antigen/teichoic acid export membrane protein
VNPMLRNFLSLALGRYLSIAIGAVVIVLMGRALSVADYGRFFAALAAAELFAAVLDLGLNRILLKEGSAARERTGAHLFNILLIKAGLTVMMLAGMQVYASHQGPLYALVMLLALTKVADNFAITFDAVFQIHQRMEYSAIILVFSRLVLLAVVLLGWRDQAQLLYFAWAYLGVSMISALLTVMASGRFATPRRGPIRWRETVGREGVFFALSSLLAMAATRMDMVVLKEAVDEHSLGLYAPPSRILVVFQILPLGPFYSRYFQRSLLLALFPLLWTLLFADVILGRLWGAAYLPGAPWLRLLVWLLPLRFIGFAAGNVLTALDRQWERTLQQALGVATSLALMFWLVPTRGVPGAILALLVGEGLAALLSLLAAARHGYRPSPLPFLRVLAAGLLAAAALLLLRRVVPLGFLGGLAATAVVVGAALLALRAASLSELRGLLRRQG